MRARSVGRVGIASRSVRRARACGLTRLPSLRRPVDFPRGVNKPASRAVLGLDPPILKSRAVILANLGPIRWVIRKLLELRSWKHSSPGVQFYGAFEGRLRSAKTEVGPGRAGD